MEQNEIKTDQQNSSVHDVEAGKEQMSKPTENATGKEKKSVLTGKINLGLIFSTIWRNRYKYIIPFVVVGVLSCLLVVTMPKVYKVTVMLAPEYNSSESSSLGGLGSLASMAGINLSSLNSQDAITPTFYPDLMNSMEFVSGLFDVKVTTQDGSFTGALSKYFTTKQKASWIDQQLGKLKRDDNISDVRNKVRTSNGSDKINPFALSKKEYELAQAIMGSITCTVDKKTDVITITTQTQDPLVTALLADTIKERLQVFITQYRTSKARNDLKNAQNLCERAHQDYIKKQKEYATFVDANQDLVLESFKAKEENLENEMQIAYTTYSGLKQQVQLHKAKVEARTPAFTTLQNASVPTKSAGPKRSIIIVVAELITFLITTIFVLIFDKNVKL